MAAKGTVLLVAGGTGGHLFPADALGLELKQRGFDVHLLTDERARRFVNAFADDHIHIISSATFTGRNPLRLMRSLFQLVQGVFQSRRLMRRLRPCLVAGFGGYPTVPPLYVATAMGIPAFIHEQNAVMGRANRFLAARVNAVAGAFPEAGDRFSGKIIITGNPVRASVIEAACVPYKPARGHMPFSLLVFGGSQGATFFSRIVPQALTLLDRPVRDRLVLTQQARPSDIEALRQACEELEMKADIQPFFSNMPGLMAHAHYIIARSGASTVAEIAAVGRPALLVPYPNALDHDQMQNAAALALSGGVRVVREQELTPDRLAVIIRDAVGESDRLAAMAAKARSAGILQATGNLADMTEALIAGKPVDDIKKSSTMKMLFNVGLIHFIGIGGIGMSGIAEVLHNLGYKVQGSDQADNANVARLRQKGIQVFVGHDAGNLGKAEVVVVSSAIRQDNPEYMATREKLLPIVRRAEMLAELMRFHQTIAIGGTHGKTTTTSLVATLLEAGGFDPTIINGGIINAYGTNARIGAGDWMVVEADESDGTFLNLPADVAVVTSIDPEHLDHYGSFDKMRAAFRQFVENVPFYGFSVMCLDHPEVQALVSHISDRRVITYGANPQADVRFLKYRIEGAHSHFDVVIRNRKTGKTAAINNLVLPMPGRHNVSNATAAVAVAHELGVSGKAIARGLASFGGVKRRFTHVGSWKGVEIFDDYGHHPVEIRAALRAARDVASGRVIAIVQPHRFSRLNDLFAEFATCFNDADIVVVAPVYAAGEESIQGVDSGELAERIKTAGHRDVRSIAGPEAVAPLIADTAGSDDCVIFLGAGNITQWACVLPRELEAGHEK